MENLKDSDLLKAFIAYGHLAITKHRFLHYLHPVYLSPTGWKPSLTSKKTDWENLLGGKFFIILKLIFKKSTGNKFI